MRPPIITSDRSDNHEVHQGGRTIDCDLDAIIFNPIPLTILKWRMYQSAVDYEGLSLVTRPLMCGN